MLSIDQQIELLQKKKLKIEVYKQILELAKSMKIEDTKIKEDVIATLTDFIDNEVHVIEYDSPIKSKKEVIKSAEPEIKREEPTKPIDKVSMHMRLINKQVKIKTTDGSLADGTITGVDVPLITVKLSNGSTIETNISKIISP